MHIKTKQKQQLTNALGNKVDIKKGIASLIRVTVVMLCLPVVASATTDTWVANGDGSVTDVATGLIWQQQDDNVTRNHAGALTYCQGLTLAGNSDWRLPNIKELTSIVDYRSDRPAIDEAAFVGTNSSLYWSASSLASSSSSAWSVSFFNGLVSRFNKTNSYFVRCVR